MKSKGGLDDVPYSFALTSSHDAKRRERVIYSHESARSDKLGHKRSASKDRVLVGRGDRGKHGGPSLEGLGPKVSDVSAPQQADAEMRIIYNNNSYHQLKYFFTAVIPAAKFDIRIFL